MCSDVGHAATDAARADAARLARERDRELVAALVAAAAHEPVREHASARVPAGLVLHVPRQRFFVRRPRPADERSDMRRAPPGPAHDAPRRCTTSPTTRPPCAVIRALASRTRAGGGTRAPLPARLHRGPPASCLRFRNAVWQPSVASDTRTMHAILMTVRRTLALASRDARRCAYCCFARLKVTVLPCRTCQRIVVSSSSVSVCSSRVPSPSVTSTTERLSSRSTM